MSSSTDVTYIDYDLNFKVGINNERRSVFS